MKTEDRFWAKVDRRGPDECWPWLGAVACKEKYGRFYVGGKMVPAHRKAWELANGMTMPKACYACHRCDNPGCVNPSHIWPGTPSQNMADAYRKGRSTVVKGNNKPREFCRNGHPLSGSNLYVSKITGYRRCHTCKIDGDRKRRAAA